jgi:predicted amidohydrolase
MKIALVQYAPVWESKNENISKIKQLLSEVDKETSLIVFPELTLTGFTMNSQQNAEEIDGIGMRFFIELSDSIKKDIVCGIIEKEGANFYNSLFHFDSGGLIKAVYRKIHPFTLANEDKNYTSSKFPVISKYDNYKIGLSICYDLRFPELYRVYAKEKVDLIINIANWPIKRIDHWKTLLKARAIENQCFMVGVNRVGTDPYQEYNGCSAVFNPMGEEIVLIENEEKIIYADIDFDDVKEVRKKLGFLNDIKLI